MLCALIMAGGKGTRFWPISTEEKPKQFLNLVGEDTMIQMTYKRINKLIPAERIFVCTGEKYISLVKEQLPQIKDRNIIREPEVKNTAPSIALSALIIKKYFNDANIVILPADHLINDDDKLIEILENGEKFLISNPTSIVTLGINPNRPECGYGYIKVCNEEIEEFSKIRKVQAFKEKPNLERAEAYLEDGSYLWNAGMFLWNADSILEKVKKYIPNTYEVLKEILECEEKDINSFIDKNYKSTDEISIDYAILEKDDEIYVIPSNIGWDDIGTWQAVERYRVKDEKENICLGRTSYIDGANNMVISSGKQIIIDGLSDIYVIESDDKIIVGLKEQIGNIKELKDKL